MVKWLRVSTIYPNIFDEKKWQLNEKNYSLTQTSNDGGNEIRRKCGIFQCKFSLHTFLRLFLAKPQACELLERVLGQ